MPDLILDSNEILAITRFWLVVKTNMLLIRELTPRHPPILEKNIHSIQDAVIEIEPLIHHLESLQMKRRHDD